MVVQRTVDEWEVEIGRQVRALRMLVGQTQANLAKQANVAVGALAALERGSGSTLKTLVSVTRALGRTDWLQQLSPAITISPLQIARDEHRNRPRQRVYTRRSRTRAEPSSQPEREG